MPPGTSKSFSMRGLFPAMAVAALACSTDNPNAPDLDSTAIPAFVLREERIVPHRPHGVAVSPDGSKLVVATYYGWQVLILDAETYSLLTEPIGHPENWGVDITPDGRQALVASRKGGWILDLDSGTQAAFLDVQSRWIASNTDGSAYYTVGVAPGEFGAFMKFDTSGRIVAQNDTNEGYHFCFALSPDDDLALVALVFRDALRVMDANTLRTRFEIPVELDPTHCILVPLDEPGLVAVVRLGNGFVDVTTVNYGQGSILARETLPLETGHLPWAPSFGRGNPWARIGTGHIVFPTNLGFLLLNSSTGRIAAFLDDVDMPVFGGLCCEAAYDPARNRLIVMGDVESLQPSPGGTLLVYDVVEGEPQR